MPEAIRIIMAGLAGIAIGLTFGYIKGYDKGYEQGYDRIKEKEKVWKGIGI